MLSAGFCGRVKPGKASSTGDARSPDTSPLRSVVVLLSITAALWVTFALFQYRVVNIFHRILIKRFPGPWVIFGAMLFCPALAATIALRRTRTGRRAPWTRATAALGVTFVLAFVTLVGVPMVVAAMQPTAPANPSEECPWCDCIWDAGWRQPTGAF